MWCRQNEVARAKNEKYLEPFLAREDETDEKPIFEEVKD